MAGSEERHATAIGQPFYNAYLGAALVLHPVLHNSDNADSSNLRLCAKALNLLAG